MVADALAPCVLVYSPGISNDWQSYSCRSVEIFIFETLWIFNVHSVCPVPNPSLSHILGVLVDSSVTENCSFIDLSFCRKASKLCSGEGSTFQVVHWKYYLAIWTWREIGEFFFDQTHLVEVCDIESRPLANLGTAWWPRVQMVDWAGLVMVMSFPCPTWQLLKSQLSSRM